MTFSPSVSINKRVKSLPIRVCTRVDGRGYIRTRTGVIYPVQVNGLLLLTDTDARTRTGVAWPYIIMTFLPPMSGIERVMFFPIRVRKHVDGRGLAPVCNPTL